MSTAARPVPPAFLLGCLLSKEQILESADIKMDVVDCPEWGGEVRIKALTLAQVQEWRRSSLTKTVSRDNDGKQVIDYLGDDNLVTATDFSHPEGRRYLGAVKELLELPQVSLESKKKIMWDNALKLYPIRP